MIEIKNLTKRYDYRKIINDLNITFPDCGLIAIVGPSGCGKTTLLHIIGGIDKKYHGEILYNNKPIKYLFRKKSIGFLFQAFHLIPWLNINDNIQLPLYYRLYDYPLYEHDLGLSQHLENHVHELSLGQRQRAAFLRMISFYPRILLCDEPTASLDEINKITIMELLKEQSKDKLVIIVSHDKECVEKYSDEIYEMKDGVIVNHIIKNYTQKSVEQDYKRKIKKPGIILSLLSMKENKSRMLLMIISLILSLTSLLLTLSLTQGFHDQLISYVDSLVPHSSISFRLKNHSLINDDHFYHDSHILHVHYYPDDYELLGITEVNDKYQQGNNIAIFDDSGYIEKNELLYGKLMTSDDEIVLSKASALRIKKDNNIKELVGREVKIWFKYQNKVKGKVMKISGISSHNQIESLYYYPGGHMNIIKEIFSVDNVNTSYGLLYVEDISSSLDYFNNYYKEYEFKQVGESTKNNIDSFMKKANTVLFFFSLFTLISSVFIIMEVMFLEVLLKRKEIAIMKCFGANSFDIILFVVYQIVIVYFIALIIAFIMFVVFVILFNLIFKSMLLVDSSLMTIDLSVIFIVFIIGLILVFFSSSIPLCYSLRINITESLKINS